MTHSQPPLLLVTHDLDGTHVLLNSAALPADTDTSDDTRDAIKETAA